MTFVNGRVFALSAGESVPAIWGRDDQVAWAEGEPCMLVAPPGVGKTTVAQQVILARAGIHEPELLGLPIAVDDRRILYLAADRPRQIARSLGRMVTDSDGDLLEAKLKVWRGPTHRTVDSAPDVFAKWVIDQGVGTLVIDSLKDICGNLAEPDVGAKVNRAIQKIIAAEVEVLILHHQRKAQGDNQKPRKLADVFGSAWLTAGAGSVILLWGDPGDPVVELRHLKQPAADIGPLKVIHDHPNGISTLLDDASLPDLLRRSGTTGLTARDAARLLYGSSDPTRNEVEKARRKLNDLHNAERIDPDKTGDAVRYLWTERDAHDPRVKGHVTPIRGSRTLTQSHNHGSRDPHAPSRTSAPPLKGAREAERDPHPPGTETGGGRERDELDEGGADSWALLGRGAAR